MGLASERAVGLRLERSRRAGDRLSGAPVRGVGSGSPVEPEIPQGACRGGSVWFKKGHAEIERTERKSSRGAEAGTVQERRIHRAVANGEDAGEAALPRLVRDGAILPAVRLDGRDAGYMRRDARRMNQRRADAGEVLHTAEQAVFLSGRGEQQGLRLPLARLERHAGVTHLAGQLQAFQID